MSIISRIFPKKVKEEILEIPVLVDMHSHLLPGIDDGVDDFNESIEIIRSFQEMGYKKLITTPHINDFYQNNPEIILAKLAELKEVLKENDIDMEVEAAAEYFMDAELSRLAKQKKLLSFGDNYVLVETSFLTENDYFHNIIFDMKVMGYQPILAHPERYVYMFNKFERYKELKEKEILLQINLGSLAGYYSKESKKIAEMLLKEGMVDFVGSDVHHVKHLPSLQAALKSPALHQTGKPHFRNNSLLSYNR